MLLHLSVSHSVHSGRGLPTPPVGRPGEGGWADPVDADPRGCRPSRDMSASGQYASYWNAYLFWFYTISTFFLKIFVAHMSIFGATDTPVLDFW